MALGSCRGLHDGLGLVDCDDLKALWSVGPARRRILSSGGPGASATRARTPFHVKHRLSAQARGPPEDGTGLANSRTFVRVPARAGALGSADRELSRSARLEIVCPAFLAQIVAAESFGSARALPISPTACAVAGARRVCPQGARRASGKVDRKA